MEMLDVAYDWAGYDDIYRFVYQFGFQYILKTNFIVFF